MRIPALASCFAALLICRSSSAEPALPETMEQLAVPPDSPPEPAAAPTSADAPEVQGGASPIRLTPRPYQPAEWYGWQTLLVDAAATAFIVGGLVQNKAYKDERHSRWYNQTCYVCRVLASEPISTTALLEVGLAMYTLGPAIVHGAHGRPIASLSSAGMRVGGPVAGIFAGFLAALIVYYPIAAFDPNTRSGWFGPVSPAADKAAEVLVYAGAAAGLIAPMFGDAIALSRVPAIGSPPAATAPAKEKPRAVSEIVPNVDLTRDGVAFRLSATF